METINITAWIIRALIILAGILVTIRINRIISILRKKYPKLYKNLGEPEIFTRSFKKGFIAMFNLEKKIILKDKSLPREIHNLAKTLRIGTIITLVVLMILLIIAAILIFTA